MSALSDEATKLANDLECGHFAMSDATAMIRRLAAALSPEAPAREGVTDAKAFKRAFWRLAFDAVPAHDNPGDCKWRLSSTAVRILADAAVSALTPRHEAPASETKRFSYRGIDGRDHEAGELPSGLVEIDEGFISQMVQAAYNTGNRDQFEATQRQIEATLKDLRHQFERRGDHK